MRWSAQIHATFHVCRTTQGHPRADLAFNHRPFTFSGVLFHTLNLASSVPYWSPTTPEPMAPVWAFPLSLATTYGITFVFFSSGYLDVSVLRVCSRQVGYYIFNIVGCPIRTSTDHSVCATPRSFSQLITSFIVSESLGIRHTPLLNLLYFLLQYKYCNELFYSILFV